MPNQGQENEESLLVQNESRLGECPLDRQKVSPRAGRQVKIQHFWVFILLQPSGMGKERVGKGKGEKEEVDQWLF